MSDEDLKFSSEEDRMKALDSFDESKGTQEELEKIMNAKIEPKAVEETPPQPAPDTPPPETPPETPPEKPPEETPPPQASVEDWLKKQGYGSIDEMQKAHEELKKTSESQTRYIKETIEKPAAPPPPPAAPPPATPDQVATQESKIASIREALTANGTKRRALAEELKLDTGLASDPEFTSRRLAVDAEQDDLNLKMVDEMTSLRSMLDTNAKTLKEYTAASEQQRIREQNTQLLQQELDEIYRFSSDPKHPEFAFSEGKDSNAVENEYIDWVNKVASALYGGQVNMQRSEQEKNAAAHAMHLLKTGDQKVVDACRSVGIPIEPDEDIKKYLDICELLDHRDGQKINPITGAKEQQYRFARDGSGNFQKVPVRFPSLEDAYQHRMATDGTYQKKIKDSYVKGTKDMATAAQKRAAAPAEMGNAAGAASADVGMAMTVQDALKAISEIDEFEAERLRLAGDPSLSDKLEQAMSVLGSATVK